MNNANVRPVIFDLDGTLVDSLEDLADALNMVLQNKGYPTHPLPAYTHFIGNGLKILVQRVLPEQARTPEIIEDCVEKFNQVYATSWNNKSALYPGVHELLVKLGAMGAPLCVLSNKPHEFTVMFGEEYLSSYGFELVLGAQPPRPNKPDPEGALRIAEHLGCAPEECLFVGDSGVDMKTARNAGMTAVGVLWGFRDEQELREGGAEHLLTRAEELLPLVQVRGARA